MLTRASFSQGLWSPAVCPCLPPSHTSLCLGVWLSSCYHAIKWYDVMIVTINCKVCDFRTDPHYCEKQTLALCAHVAFSPIQNVLPFILIKTSENRIMSYGRRGFPNLNFLSPNSCSHPLYALWNIACREPITGLKAHTTDTFIGTWKMESPSLPS